MTDGSPSPAEGASFRVRLERLTRTVILGWALLGGALLVGIVLLTAYSAAANLLVRQPVPGDFELVEMGVAIAVSCFLPYCQLTYANVTVDIFTTRAGPRMQAAMSLVASLVAFFFAALLFWRMWEGFLDYRQYQEYTAIIGIPLWAAFPPFLASIFLLAVAAVLTSVEQVSALRTGKGSATGLSAY